VGPNFERYFSAAYLFLSSRYANCKFLVGTQVVLGPQISMIDMP
jgi:hypothetical protein